MSFSSLDKQTHDEYASTFAALILFDDNIEVTADKINKLIKASGNTVEGYWPQLFAKALQGRKLSDLLAGGAPAPAAGATTTTAAVPEGNLHLNVDNLLAKKEEPKKKEEEKKKVEEDTDVGLGGGLFGDDF
jgi:large subunit ribosomal protein LP1